MRGPLSEGCDIVEGVVYEGETPLNRLCREDARRCEDSRSEREESEVKRVREADGHRRFKRRVRGEQDEDDASRKSRRIDSSQGHIGVRGLTRPFQHCPR